MVKLNLVFTAVLCKEKQIKVAIFSESNLVSIFRQ